MEIENSKPKHTLLAYIDGVSVAMVGICAVHCLLTPIILLLLPVLATTVFVHHDFHVWMLVATIPTTGLAIMMGCRRHKDKWVFALAGVGILFMLVAIVWAHPIAHPVAHGGHVHHAHGVEPYLETVLTMIGGLFLASAHIRNFYLCRKSNCDHGHGDCCQK